jgi:hypothetical protein
MPLPSWDKKTLGKIAEHADLIIKGKASFDGLDDYIMCKYAFSFEEINYLKGFSK